MLARIRGRDYRLAFVRRLKNRYGLCDPPWKKRPRISIRPHTRDDYLLETLIHEALHAAFWDMDERAVTEAARDIRKLLWGLGWRLEKRSKNCARKRRKRSGRR